jgi:Tol biopolymer transport system component
MKRLLMFLNLRILFIAVSLLGFVIAQAQTLKTALAQKAPATATLFAPGIISDGLNNRDFTMSPDGNEVFYTIQSQRFLKSTIVHIQKQKGIWQQPEIASFSGKHRDLEAFFSPDGKTVYFSSDRFVNASDSTHDFDIWKVEKTKTGWSDPIHLGNKVNSAKNEFYPSVSKSGNIYFTAMPANGYGEEDIVMCRYAQGIYLDREILDTAINTKGDEFNAFVDPDEKMIVFSCYKARKDELGGGDLYISYKNATGKWEPAVNMGTAVNSNALDYCPFVSWDKKTLYFASNRNRLATSNPSNYEDLHSVLSSAGNTSDDIYYVDFSSFIKTQ